MAKNDGRIECFELLGKHIAIQAFIDWLILKEGREIASPKKHRRKSSAIAVSYEEIREFLQSEWGSELCKLFKMKTAEQFLEMLEEIRESDVSMDASSLYKVLDNKARQERIHEYDPCDRCTRNLCYGCEYCEEV